VTRTRTSTTTRFI